MDSLEVPIVVVAQKIEGYPSVFHDDYSAAKEVTSYLLNKGHENIGFIGVYEEDISVGFYRKNGYLDALREKNIEVKSDNIKIGVFSQESGYNLAKELMSNDNKPTAIFAVTDNLAIGAIEYLKESGFKIPGDISIVGMGDSRMAAVITPKLTTIHYHYKTSGRQAAEIMLELLNKENKNIKNIKLPYRFIERDSV
jgi:LacI family sucrose operon transcriptional repressor